MAVCPNCGEDNPERARFCLECGGKLQAHRAAVPHEARKTVTVVFSDLVGSTALGERLDSEALREVMDRYFGEMSTALERHGGTVEKYIGDAIMAVFGLPRVHEDDALRAVRAARDMSQALADLNQELTSGWGVTLANRTGVHTGEVVVGDASSGQRLATGDAVNVAARLEQAAAHGEVLLSKDTHDLLRDAVEVEAVEPLSLKGKAMPVSAFRLLDVRAGEGVRRRLDAPMVGRHDELALLLDAFARTGSGRRWEVVTVIGEPGLGKTRLIKELEGAVATDARVLTGRCLPYGTTTFWPLAEVLYTAAGLSEADSPETVRRELCSLAGTDDSEDVVERLLSLLGLSDTLFPLDESLWAAREFLATLARRERLVVVFEDLHWAQSTFLDFIELLMGRPSGVGLLLVCSTRPELHDSRPGWMEKHDSAKTLHLETLTAADSEQLVASLVPVDTLGDEAKRRVVTAAEGNPLFVEQLVAMWADPDGGEGMIQRPIPPTISALLSARLDQLPSEQRAVTAAASVIGQVFYRDAVRALQKPRSAPIEESLQGLVTKMFVRSSPSDLGGEVAYAFRHALIRDAAYDALLKKTRADLHEHFATWLTCKVTNGQSPHGIWASMLGPAPIDMQAMVGYHLEQAHRHRTELARSDDHTWVVGREAGRLLGRAGRAARDQEDIPSAVAFLRRAVGLIRDAGSERLELLLYLGEALFEGGEFRNAIEVLEEAATLAEACGDERLSARLATVRLLVRRETHPHGWVQEIRATAPDIISRLEHCSDDAGLADAWIAVSYAHLTAGQTRRGHEAAERAVAYAERAGERANAGRYLTHLTSSALVGPTHVEDGIAVCHRALERLASMRGASAIVKQDLAGLESLRGNFERAQCLFVDGVRVLEELGMNYWVASGSWPRLAEMEVLRGDLESAEHFLVGADSYLRERGEKGVRSTVVALLAHVKERQGEHERAVTLSQMSEDLTDDDDFQSLTLWRGARAKALAALGDREVAVGLARSAVETAHGSDWLSLQGNALMDLADVYRRTGDIESARAVLHEALGRFQAKGSSVLTAGANRALAEWGAGAKT